MRMRKTQHRAASQRSLASWRFGSRPRRSGPRASSQAAGEGQRGQERGGGLDRQLVSVPGHGQIGRHHGQGQARPERRGTRPSAAPASVSVSVPARSRPPGPPATSGSQRRAPQSWVQVISDGSSPTCAGPSGPNRPKPWTATTLARSGSVSQGVVGEHLLLAARDVAAVLDEEREALAGAHVGKLLRRRSGAVRRGGPS